MLSKFLDFKLLDYELYYLSNSDKLFLIIDLWNKIVGNLIKQQL